MMKPGPYIEYTSFPDWNRTRMRRAAWEFFGHSDCEGGFEDTKETLRFLQWLSGRVVETGRYDADNEALLHELIDVFEVSDEVEFL